MHIFPQLTLKKIAKKRLKIVRLRHAPHYNNFYLGENFNQEGGGDKNIYLKFNIHPCNYTQLTLCPGNSATMSFSWLSQTLTLGRWPHSPVTRYRPSSDLGQTS